MASEVREVERNEEKCGEVKRNEREEREWEKRRDKEKERELWLKRLSSDYFICWLYRNIHKIISI